MKVKELITELQKHDPEKIVVQSGYDGGYGEVSRVTEIRLKLNVFTAWYWGPHEEDEDGECEAINIG